MFNKRKKPMSMDNLFSILQVITHAEKQGPCLTLRDFTYLYSLSKSIVIEESKTGIQYLRVKFHEMIEVIARVANFKYDNTPWENLPLDKKIEKVLEELFQHHLGIGHNSADMLSDDESSSGESEEDY